MKKRRQWTTYSGSGKRVAPRTRTSRVSRGKEMGVPRLWVQLIVCGALFVALIGLKLLMPGNLSALRGTLGQWLVRDADFISAFSAVGRAASGEQDWGDSLSEAYVAVFGGESKAQEVSGNLIGMTVSEQDVSDLTSARELPALAVGEQRILGFSYTTPLSGTVTSPFGWRRPERRGRVLPLRHGHRGRGGRLCRLLCRRHRRHGGGEQYPRQLCDGQPRGRIFNALRPL